jgi:hypothetical protein
MTVITLEYAAPMIKEAAAEDYQPIFGNKGTGTSESAEALLAEHAPNGNGGHGIGDTPMDAPISDQAPGEGFTWTPEAQQRLERVPPGFMRDCTRSLIQKHAGKVGATVITLDVANQGIEQAKGFMEEAMKTGNLKDIIANLSGASKAG